MSMSHLSRVVWKVSLPIVLAAASETLLHVIDTLLLARVGVAELGAIAIADSVLLLSLVIPLSFVEALQILASRHAGQRRPAAAGAVFNAGFLTVFVISVVTSVALKFLWPLLGNWFVGPGGVGTAIGDYLQIAAYGIFLVAASFAYSALLVASGKTRALIPATILLAATSIPLSYALIFGKFGFPRMGMRGAALGSLAAEAVTFLFLTICVVRTFDSARYRLFRFHIADWRSLRLLTRLSASIAAQRSLEVIRWFVFFLILERVSLEALAIAKYRLHLPPRLLDSHRRFRGDFVFPREPLHWQERNASEICCERPSVAPFLSPPRFSCWPCAFADGSLVCSLRNGGFSATAARACAWLLWQCWSPFQVKCGSARSWEPATRSRRSASKLFSPRRCWVLPT